MEMILAGLSNKMTSRMAESWVEDVVIANEDEDLSSWEIINPSDDENADFSFDDDDEEDVSVIESLSSDISSQSPPENLIRPPEMEVDSHDRFRRKQLSTELSILGRFGYTNQYYQHHHDEDDEGEEDEGEEEWDEYEDELDDELVPKSVSDRFLRNRIRKLGKREYSKMAKSKRLPYLYNRPGCVRGKHGLGLKHSLM